MGEKQGRIHGYQSWVRVGRGNNKMANPSIWAGALKQEPPVRAENVNEDRRTD